MKLMAYAALAYSYWVDFYEVLQFKLPYKSCRIFLTNHMVSTSCHTMLPKVNNSG